MSQDNGLLEAGNIIGPFDSDEWMAMRTIRSNLKYYKANNDNGKFDVVIDKWEVAYKDLLGSNSNRNVA